MYFLTSGYFTLMVDPKRQKLSTTQLSSLSILTVSRLHFFTLSKDSITMNEKRAENHLVNPYVAPLEEKRPFKHISGYVINSIPQNVSVLITLSMDI